MNLAYRSFKIQICMIVLVILTSAIIPSQAYANRTSEIAPIADMAVEPKAYILVDAKEGRILAQKNAKEAINVASTGKLITALAAVSTINKNELIEVPREAQEVQPTKIGMSVGEKWKRDDLLHALLLVSANDAAYALAEAASGSIKKFGKDQKRIASELGMEHSTFGDPSGLDDSLAVNGETKMSAYDLAIASRAVLANPDLSRIVSTMNYQFVGGDEKPHTLTNHNDKFLDGYEGANGMKTGFTRKSGRTLVASATKNGNTLIAVVLNVSQTDAWAVNLLDQGFAMIESDSIAEDVETLPAIGVIGSKANVTILNEPPTNDNDEVASGQTPVATSNGESSGTNIPVGIVTAIILFGLFIAFILRRRAVIKRRKLRKLKAARMREMQRRAMIDVIDLETEQQSEFIKR